MTNNDQDVIDSSILEAAWRHQLIAPLLKDTDELRKGTPDRQSCRAPLARPDQDRRAHRAPLV
jgi:hypothetical protein